MTPPDSTWHIKVPRESAAAIAAVLERAAPNLPPDNDRGPIITDSPTLPGQGPFHQVEVPDQTASGEFLQGGADEPAGPIAALPVVPRQGVVPFRRTLAAVYTKGIFPLEIPAEPDDSRLDCPTARGPPAEESLTFFDG